MEWPVAFLVHSTLWCSLAWLCLRFFPKAHPRLRETIWYTAIAASLITPTAQTFTSPESAFWRLPIPSLTVSSEGVRPEREAGHEEALASVFTHGEESHGEDAVAVVAAPAWLGFVNGTWLLIAAALLLCYFIRLEALRKRLRCREIVQDPRASRALAALSQRAGLSVPPRLSESHNLGSPVALGFGGRCEICVPVRALHELGDDELSALLGHELAHHLRRDTIRLGVLNTLQAVFFFQPLFRLASREIHFAVEEQCDDWAARQVNDPFAMATCLTQVAGWVVRQDRRIPVPCMGRRRSQLELRVRRQVDELAFLRPPSKALRNLCSVGLLVVAPWLAPAIVSVPTEVSHEGGGRNEQAQEQGRQRHGVSEHARVKRDEDSERQRVLRHKRDEHGEQEGRDRSERGHEQKR